MAQFGNAPVGIIPGDPSAAFVQNLENKLVLTGVGAGANGVATFADPRLFGIRGGAKF